MKKRIFLIITICVALLSFAYFPKGAMAKSENPTHTSKPTQVPTKAVLRAAATPTPTTIKSSPTARPTSKPTTAVPSSAKTSSSAANSGPTHKPSLTPTRKPAVSASLKKPSTTPTPTKRVSIPGQLAPATVTGVKGSTITITKDKKSYTVLAVNGTSFRKHYWGSSTLQDVSVGDKVNVTGNFINSSKTIMEATLIRNLSIVKRRGVIFGTITAVGGNTLTIKPKDHVLQKVTVTSKTSYVDRSESKLLFSQLKVGDQIRVKGMWDRGTNTVTEVTQIKDFSQPLTGSPSAKAH